MGILNTIKGKTSKSVKGGSAAASKKDVAGVASTTKTKGMKSDFASRILVRPIVSEKTTHQEAHKKYSFFVTKDATKIDVKRAVKEVYGVLPMKVNMVVGEGKVKRAGRGEGRRNHYKKAIVTVAQDKNLAIHEGV